MERQLKSELLEIYQDFPNMEEGASLHLLRSDEDGIKKYEVCGKVIKEIEVTEEDYVTIGSLSFANGNGRVWHNSSGGNLNIRAGAGTNHAVVGTLANRANFTQRAHTVAVTPPSAHNDSLWVHDFSPTGAPGTWHFNTARATEFVWQRTTTAAPHRWVNHLQRTTHWTRNFNNQTGWNVNRVGTWAPNVVHTTLGSSPGTNPSTQARTNSNLNLRATARLTGNLLATIPNGSLVTLLGASTNADGEHWTNISWNGHRGWSVTRGLNFFA